MDRLPGSEKENPWSKPQNARGALGIGGLAAVLASICCVGPLVLVSIGISGAWIGNLTVFEPYRPIFIGAALVALFFAYRRIFRPAQAWGGLCRTASQDGVQEHLLDRGRTDGGRACVPLHSAAVVLKGQRYEKAYHCYRNRPLGRLERTRLVCHANGHPVGGWHDLRVLPDHH